MKEVGEKDDGEQLLLPQATGPQNTPPSRCVASRLTSSLCCGRLCSCVAFIGIAALLASPPAHASFNLHVRPDSEEMLYEGRWVISAHKATSDWPCSKLKLRAVVGTRGGQIQVGWRAVRSRLNVSVAEVATGETYSEVWQGSTFSLLHRFYHHSMHVNTLSLPAAGNYTVTVTKLTEAAPFNMGLMRWLLDATVLEVRGVRTSDDVQLLPPSRLPRHIEAIGASDTAGWCADGERGLSMLRAQILSPYLYSNCQRSYASLIGAHFNAEVRLAPLAMRSIEVPRKRRAARCLNNRPNACRCRSRHSLGWVSHRTLMPRQQEASSMDPCQCPTT